MWPFASQQTPFEVIDKAIRNRNFGKALETIRKNGIDINSLFTNGYGLAHFAVLYDEANLYVYLHHCHADFNLKDMKGETPLIVGIKNPLEIPLILKYVIEDVNTDVNITDDVSGNSPLHWTIDVSLSYNIRSFMIADLLIKHGACVNARNHEMETPLHLTINFGDIVNHIPPNEDMGIEWCKLLLDKGADINAKSKNGWTPLIRAVCFRHPKMVKYLLSTGPDVNMQDTDGLSALCFAFITNQAEIAKLLLERGANKNIVHKDDSLRKMAENPFQIPGCDKKDLISLCDKYGIK